MELTSNVTTKAPQPNLFLFPGPLFHIYSNGSGNHRYLVPFSPRCIYTSVNRFSVLWFSIPSLPVSFPIDSYLWFSDTIGMVVSSVGAGVLLRDRQRKPSHLNRESADSSQRGRRLDGGESQYWSRQPVVATALYGRA